MSEFNRHLDHYRNHWTQHFSCLVSESNWGDKDAAALYLERYWLCESEYNSVWKAVQNSIFTNQSAGLPDSIFSNEYEVLCQPGGCLFDRDDFDRLKSCLSNIGDDHLIIIENTFGGMLEEPAFRFKFPAKISWDELIAGNYISAVVFGSLYKEFFVFGKSASWGKYSAADEDSPLDVLGFKKDQAPLFKRQFALKGI